MSLPGFQRLHGFIALCVTLLSVLVNVAADESLIEPRMLVGVNLFPAFLAARTAPPSKPDHVAVVYAQHNTMIDAIAASLANRLRKTDPRIRLSLVAVDQFIGGQLDSSINAVFVAQPLLTTELDPVLAASTNRQILTFSPIAGDVARGIMGGIAVSDRILPSVNIHALRKNGIELKAFFLRVSIQYASADKK